MGQALVSCAKNFRDLAVVAQVDRGDDLRAVIAKGDVVIDFSSHDATPGIVELCAKNKKAIVIGTTGHSETEKAAILKCQIKIPDRLASNFSTGVNTLFWLTRKAAEILGPDFDLEIVEMHHRLKKDAPSGTAKSLAEILADVRKQQLEKIARHGRLGMSANAHPAKLGFIPFAAAMLSAITRSFLRTTVNALNSRTKRRAANFCQRCLARGALGRETKARTLRHAGRAGIEIGQVSSLSLFNFSCDSKIQRQAGSLSHVALGSNLGDSRRIILDAMTRLQSFSDEPIFKSSLWQTSPVDCAPDSPKFVNAIIGLIPKENETPESLLKKLRELEIEFGRAPKAVLNEPRPLDLDLIAFGNEIHSASGNSPELILPHPRAHLRKFVLQPLSEIAPELILPGQGKTVSQLLAELSSNEIIVKCR